MRDHRGQGRPLDPHIQREDKDGIQYDIGYSAAEHRRHSHASEALAVDEAVHPKADHYKYTAAEIDRDILICERKGFGAGAKSIQKRPFQKQSRHRQDCPGNEKKNKGIPHNALRFPLVSSAAGYSTQRSAAHPEEIGKSDNHSDNGKAYSKACHGQGSVFRHSANVNAVSYTHLSSIP